MAYNSGRTVFKNCNDERGKKTRYEALEFLLISRPVLTHSYEIETYQVKRCTSLKK